MMTTILIFTGALIALNCIPLLFKKHSRELEKVINRVLIAITIIFGILTLLLFYDYRLKGHYSNSIVALLFIISGFFYFILIKVTWKKLMISLLLIPPILLSIYTLLFGQTIYENKIDRNYKIETYVGGFLACGESVRITHTAYWIFDKAIYHKNLCIKGITKIKTAAFNSRYAEFQIFHDKELDSENPYNYRIENKGIW